MRRQKNICKISIILICIIFNIFFIIKDSTKKDTSNCITMKIEKKRNLIEKIVSKENEIYVNEDQDCIYMYNTIYLPMDDVFKIFFTNYDEIANIQTINYRGTNYEINKTKNIINVEKIDSSNGTNIDNSIEIILEENNNKLYVPIYFIANLKDIKVKVNDKNVYDKNNYKSVYDVINEKNKINSIEILLENSDTSDDENYFGEHEGALWREEAFTRIERYRKRTQNIIVKNINDLNIKNTKIKINMKDNEFEFGTSTGYISEKKLTRNYFNILGAQGDFKWERISIIGYEEAQKYVIYAQKNNMRLRGHCLWWDYPCSKEVTKYIGNENDEEGLTMAAIYNQYKNHKISKEEAIDSANQIQEQFEKTVYNHISEEINYFPYVSDWDVVNEPLSRQYFKYYLYDQNFIENNEFLYSDYNYKNSYIENEKYYKFLANCFDIARNNNKNAKLVINDNIIKGNVKNNVIQDDLNIINGIKKYTDNIDAIGVQYHNSFDNSNSPQAYYNKINYIVEQTGIKEIQITEYDNIEKDIREYSSKEKNVKANFLRDALISSYSNKNISEFEMWLYTSDNFCDEERQAYKELVYPWLNYTEEGTTGEDGYTTRLYKGTYTATVTLPNGKTKDIEFTVSDNTSDTVEVIINSEITDVKIKQQPSKLKYYRNDNIDLTDGILEISYDDGTTKEIQMNDSNISVSGFDSSSLGKQTIRLNYEGHEVHFDVNIEEKKETLIKNSIINIENCNKNIKENYNYIANNNNILSKYNDMISKLEELKNNINDIDNSKINNAYKSEYDLILEIIKEYNQNAINQTEEKLKDAVNSIIELTNDYMELYKYYFDNDTINNDEIANSLNEIIDKYNENNDINVSFEEYYINKIKELYNNDITGNNNYANYLNKKRILNTIDIISYTLENKIKETAQQEAQKIGIAYNIDPSTLTNKDVIAQIKLPNSKSSIESNPNNEKYTFTENGTKNITINIRGYKYNYNIKVTNIDKTPPQITGIEQGGKYKESITPQIKDANLSEVKLTKDGQEVENYKANTSITQEGIYQLTATDKAGNQTTINFVIAYPEDEKYKIENNTIKNVKGGTSVSMLKGKIQVAEKYSIKRKNTEIQDNENVATGDILETESGDTYTVIVRGDINKDGSVDIKDLVKMRRYLLLGNNLDESEVMAADTNLDGKEISVKDLVKMRIILLTQ